MPTEGLLCDGRSRAMQRRARSTSTSAIRPLHLSFPEKVMALAGYRALEIRAFSRFRKQP